MTAPELKPCPFCGGEALISKDHDPDGNGAFYAVKCRKCRAKSPEIYAVETCNIHFAQVRDAWNRRADLAAVQPAPVRVKWDKIETAPRGGEWFIARTEHGTTRVVHFADEYDRFPISHDGVVWSTAPIEWTPLRPVLAALEPLPDQTVEIDLRVAMMEELEKAASESPWVPEEYYMNEVISDCCAFLRSDRSQPDPRDEVIARLAEATEQFLIEYDEVDLAVHEPKSLTDAVYEARAALAAAKAVQHD